MAAFAGSSEQRGRTSTVESHPSGTRKVMLSNTDPLNPLLGHDIASCEEDLDIDINHLWVSLRHPVGCSIFSHGGGRKMYLQRAGKSPNVPRW